jgi:hypothetical protein
MPSTTETVDFYGSTTEESDAITFEATTTTPTPGGRSDPVTKVVFKAKLLMSLTDFTPDIRNTYANGVAMALSVSVSTISIGSVVEIQGGRRLLATSIEVETIATIPSEIAESTASAVTTDNIHAQLASSSISVGSISEPALEVVIPETPTPQPNACGAGKYSSFDNTACVTCPSGMYSTDEYAKSFATCVPCPLSTHSHKVGATSSSECIACETGKFTYRIGSSWIGQCKIAFSIYTC